MIGFRFGRQCWSSLFLVLLVWMPGRGRHVCLAQTLTRKQSTASPIVIVKRQVAAALGKIDFDSSRVASGSIYPESPNSSSWNDPANTPFVAESLPSAPCMCFRTPNWLDLLARRARRSNRQISSPRHAPQRLHLLTRFAVVEQCPEGSGVRLPADLSVTSKVRRRLRGGGLKSLRFLSTRIGIRGTARHCS